jgi:hypothetical protein
MSTGGVTCSPRARAALADPPEPTVLAGGGALAAALSSLDLVHARHPNDKNKIVIPRISARRYGTACEFASRADRELDQPPQRCALLRGPAEPDLAIPLPRPRDPRWLRNPQDCDCGIRSPAVSGLVTS